MAYVEEGACNKESAQLVSKMTMIMITIIIMIIIIMIIIKQVAGEIIKHYENKQRQICAKDRVSENPVTL